MKAFKPGVHNWVNSFRVLNKPCKLEEFLFLNNNNVCYHLGRQVINIDLSDAIIIDVKGIECWYTQSQIDLFISNII